MAKTKYTPPGWGTMTPAQKRVCIARDVIAELNAQRYEARREAGYVRLDVMNEGELAVRGSWDESLNREEWLVSYSDEKIVDRLGDLNSENCHVCALGGCVLSAVKFNNGTTVKEIKDTDWDDSKRRLKGIFSHRQMDMIEVAFEADTYTHTILAGRVINRCLAFHDEIQGDYGVEDSVILEAIMQNIVDHKGDFKPEVLYVTA